MTDVARTVSVRLEANVASYIASMRLAGRETDAAFRGAGRNVDTADTSMSRLGTTTDRTRTSTIGLNREIDNTGRTLNRNQRDIDRYGGRLKLIGQALAILGPAAVPIGAIAVPAVAGLAAQLGFAALAGGAAIIAFQGVGDALTAVNKANLAPTVENLQKAQIAMENLAPAGRGLVRELGSLSDTWKGLRFASQEGLFPGVTDGLEQLERLAPRVQGILLEVSDTAGDLFRAGATDLAGPEWADFFDFIATNARPALTELGQSIGHVTHGLAELWMAFDPLNDDFSRVILDAAEGFDAWAEGLSQTQGFQDFVDYIRVSGPQVGATLGALAQALLDIVEAAAPLGGPVLQALETVAKVISAIADSNLGTPLFAGLAAMSLLSRATALWGTQTVVATRGAVVGYARTVAGLVAVTGAQQRATLSAAELAAAQRTSFVAARGAALRGAAAMAGFALAASGAAKSTGVSNTASLALMGTLAGPWGAAVGAGVGLTLDLAHATDSLTAATKAADAALESGNLAEMQSRRDELQAQIDAATGNAVFGFDVGGLGGIVNTIAPLSNVTKTMGELTGATDDAKGSLSDLDQAILDAKGAGSGLGGIYAAGLGMTADAFHAATVSAADFAAQIEILSGILDRRGSLRAYEAALDDFSAAIKENGKTLDISTEAGRANQTALDNVAKTAIEAAKQLKGTRQVEFLQAAIADLGKIAKTSPAATKQVGILRGEIERLVGGKHEAKIDADTSKADAAVSHTLDRLYAVDKETAHPKIDLNDDAARSGIFSFQSLLNTLNGTSATTYITTVHRDVNTGIGPQEGYAAGGMTIGGVRAYAGGGMDRANLHRAEMAGPGRARVWREPETGGESYIPHRNDWRRPRAKRITEKTAAMFGGSVSWHASGDFQPVRGDGMRRVPGGGGGWASGRAQAGHMTVSGTLESPLGLIRIVEGTARLVARDEIDADAEWSRRG